ncbi:hypothetical protein BaRGS_00008601 [Batillaria attramentaria]|uniref:Band 7 domain-containing protein n=1 Tax=Batillaria attramentaria TaxID=370345 RepID=A0ABD0LKJ6_9CAEN
MSVRYTRVPSEDSLMESGLTFDYSSAFNYEDHTRSNKYASAFSYSSASRRQVNDDMQLDTDNRSATDRACYYFINVIIYVLFILTFPVTVWFAFKVVPNFERMVVFRWGRLHHVKGPGMVFVMPFIDRCHKVDIRMKAFTVPPQQVITGDGAIIEVGADVYYRISSPEHSITCIQNLDKSSRILVQSSLLNHLVRLPLAKIEGHRNSIAETVLETCNKASRAWGIEICRLDLSQVKVLQKPLASQNKPSLMFPPGLGGLGSLGDAASSLTSGSVPEAFQQLASAFMAAQGMSFQAQDEAGKQPSIVEPAPFTYDNTTAASDLAVGGAGDTPPPLTVREILQAAQRVLSESLVRKVDAVYQFQLHGEGGSVYFLNLKHGSGSLGEGVWPEEGEVDASLMMTVMDLQQMLLGNLKPFQAYMSGRLRVSGDLAAALRLETFVDKVVELAKSR